jgi:hypothetical protein
LPSRELVLKSRLKISSKDFPLLVSLSSCDSRKGKIRERNAYCFPIQSIIYFMLHCHKLKNQFSHIYLRRRKRRIMSLKFRFPLFSSFLFASLYLLRSLTRKDRELKSCVVVYEKKISVSELLRKLVGESFSGNINKKFMSNKAFVSVLLLFLQVIHSFTVTSFIIPSSSTKIRFFTIMPPLVDN